MRCELTKGKAPALAGDEALILNPNTNQGNNVNNSTATPQKHKAPAFSPTESRVRSCVLYMKGGVELRTAWFTDRSRAKRALAVMGKRYGPCVLYRD